MSSEKTGDSLRRKGTVDLWREIVSGNENTLGEVACFYSTKWIVSCPLIAHQFLVVKERENHWSVASEVEERIDLCGNISDLGITVDEERERGSASWVSIHRRLCSLVYWEMNVNRYRI